MRVIAEALPAKRQTLLFSATMTASLVAMQEHALPDAFHFQVPCAPNKLLHGASCASSGSGLWAACIVVCIEWTLALVTAGIRGAADSVEAAAGVCVHTLQGQRGRLNAHLSGMYDPNSLHADWQLAAPDGSMTHNADIVCLHRCTSSTCSASSRS
jgi:hypothetical protein